MTTHGTSSTPEVVHVEHFTRVLGLHHVTASGIGWFLILPAVGIVATAAMATQLDLQPIVIAFGLLATGVVIHYAGKKIRL